MNHTRARMALSDFYNAALGKLPVKSLDELVEHYRTHVYPDGEILKHDDFLDDFDGALKVANPVDTKTAMKNLAAATPKGKLPNTQAFFKALSDQTLKLTAREFTTAVKLGLQDTAKVAMAGAGVYVAIALGVFLLPYLLKRAKAA